MSISCIKMYVRESRSGTGLEKICVVVRTTMHIENGSAIVMSTAVAIDAAYVHATLPDSVTNEILYILYIPLMLCYGCVH